MNLKFKKKQTVERDQQRDKDFGIIKWRLYHDSH